MKNKKPIVTLDEDGNEIARYESRNDCAKALGVTPATLNYRLTNGRSYNGIICKYLVENNVIKPKPKVKPPVRKDKPIDYTKGYRIITYEIKSKYLCLTPCPFKKIMGIKVGSVGCEQCTSFRGRDRENLIIACNYSLWTDKK